MEGLLSLLNALPRLLAIAEKLGRAFEYREVLEWINQVEASVDQLGKAKTKDEKAAAALSIVAAIRALE